MKAAERAASLRGHEPSLEDMENLEPEDFRFIEAYNWYSTNLKSPRDEAHKFITDYMAESGGYSESEIYQIKIAPEWQLGTACGWLARMATRGIQLPKSKIIFLKTRISENLVSDFLFLSTKEEKAEKKRDTIQDKIREAAGDLIGRIMSEEDYVIICGEYDFDIIKFLSENKVSSVLANHIKNYYVKQYQTFVDAIEQNDKTIVTGREYSYFYQHANFIKEIIDGCSSYTSVKKTTEPKKPRKKRIRKISVVIKKLKYQQSCNDPKLISIDPAKIVGADQLWVYNTKLRQLAVYNGRSGGFDIKGTTLQNFSSDSCGKTLRKPQETLDKLISCGKVVLRKFMDGINSKPKKLKGRINKDTILIRVEK